MTQEHNDAEESDNHEYEEDTACYRGTVMDIITDADADGVGVKVIVLGHALGEDRLRWIGDAAGPNVSMGDRVGLWGWYVCCKDEEGYACEIEQGLPRALALIPSLALPEEARPALKALVGLTEQLTYRPLLDFIDDALGAEDVYQLFFSRPASRACHHDRPGGLAIHSAEVATNVASLPENQFSSPVGRQCAIAAAVVQDIGKIELYGAGFINAGIAHESRGIKILGAALMRLQAVDKNVGEFVEMLLDPSRQGRGDCPEKIVLSLADRMSACADASQKAFAQAPSWQAATTLKIGDKKRLFFRPVARQSAQRGVAESKSKLSL